jgi:hypothetical protein
MRYVDLNPVRAGLTDAAWEWPWSSARVHCVPGAGDLVLAIWRDMGQPERRDFLRPSPIPRTS